MGMKLKRLSSIGVGRFRRPSSSQEGGGGGVDDQQSQKQMMKRPSHRYSSYASHRTSTTSSTSSRRIWGSSLLKQLPSMSRLGGSLSYIPCQELPLVPRRSGNEIAIVACGSSSINDVCSLWKLQQQIQMLVGVTRVLPGYTGGEEYPHVAPNYEKMYDHMYGLFIEYNPKMISYTEIISTACCHDNSITRNKNGSSVLNPMRVTATSNDNNVGNKDHQRRQPTVLFPHSAKQQHECIEYLHHVHDIVKRCSTVAVTATDGTDRTSDESESSSGGDYNYMGDVGLRDMGDIIRRPLSIDVRQVGPFYKAEDRFCETGRSSAVL